MARMCMWRMRGSVVVTGLISSCLTFLISVCTGSWSVPLKMANSLSGTVILQTRWVLCFLSDKRSFTVYYIHCGHLHSCKVAVWAWRKGCDVTTVHIHTQFTHLLTLHSFSPVPRSLSSACPSLPNWGKAVIRDISNNWVEKWIPSVLNI